MDDNFQIQEWVVSPKLNSLRNNGRMVHLEPKVMQVLVCLAKSPDVVSKEKLMRTVWADTFVTDDVLTRSISELRKVFDDDKKNPRFIQTIPKGGYRLVAPVEEVKKPEPAEVTPATAAPKLLLPRSRQKIWLAAVAGLLVLLLATSYFIGRQNAPPSTSVGRAMLAVLPFQNLSNDPGQDFFADGLTAEMISQFGRLPSDRLGVIAWASMARYKGTSKSEDQISSELGANYLLEGTVRRSGDQVRITAELIERGKRDHLWSNSYDGNLKDVLALQNRVAREIASEIRVQLSPQEEARLSVASPVNSEGYDAYLKAKLRSEMPGKQTMQANMEHLRTAIRLNPGYAPPYVAMAVANRALASQGAADPKLSYAAARSLLVKALELDPDSSTAHRELGWVEWRYDWNFTEAEKEFRSAIQLNPNDASLRDIYALFLKSMGRFEDALAQSKQAVELSPMESFSRANQGSLLALMKRFDQANEQYEKAAEIDPQHPYVYERMGPVLLMQGRNADAIAALEKARDYSGGQQDKLAWLGYAYAVSRRKLDALKVLEQLQKIAEGHQYVSPLHTALVHNGLGDNEAAIAWLEKAYQARDEYLVYLSVYPEFQNLHSDKRFQAIERRIGLLQ
ncbi:MAG TPA: winged helix-turn-helix domain-containing protein [Terriglobales bacterium]|jgi:TolB-like protein/DNA-binding winged helix-turn-helix (wHTH) protein/Tfp pilus assembly protein PilF|nr:winged helix-turn-helix domain-containing protein [Terriglobales bacterium]